MPILHVKLPSFSALVAFECVERLGSFSAAARELHVTQVAISQKVQELETWLGERLIIRRRPQIEMTADGLKIAEAIRAGVSIISFPLEMMRARRQHPNQVTLAAVNAFSLFWLTPRLHRFYAAHPEIDLNLLTSDREIAGDRQSFDLGITFTNHAWSDYDEHLLFDDEVIAVASPGYAAARAKDSKRDDFSGDTLLHLDYVEPSWMDWPVWLKACGIDRDFAGRRQQFSNFILLIQGAIEGRGVALGWRRLIDPLLARRQLVRIGHRSIIPEARYQLLVNKRFGDSLSPGVRSLKKWLLEEAISEPVHSGGRR